MGDTSGDLSLYNIDKDLNLSPENRIVLTVETNYSIISPAIPLTDSNLESNYCIGNINGEIKCFKLENVNGFSLTEWASLKIDGWLWSDMKLITDKKSLFVISLSGNLYKISADPDSKSLKIIWQQEIDKNGNCLLYTSPSPRDS